MKTLISHKINLPAELMIANWDNYSAKYHAVEKRLSKASQTFPAYLHATGAYQVRSKVLQNDSIDPVVKYFQDENHSIKQSSKTILRGLYYFPALVDQSYEGQKTVIVFEEILALSNLLLNHVNSETHFVLFLALLDNLKNHLLLILNAIHQFSVGKDSSPIGKTTYSNLNELILMLEFYQFSTLISEKVLWSTQTIDDQFFVTKLQPLREVFLNSSLSSEQLVRKMRECNHPYKIMVFADQLATQYIAPKTLIAGFSYGGIELPFAVNAMRLIKSKSRLPYVIISLSNYSTNSSNYSQDLQDVIDPFTSEAYLNKFSSVLALDDSSTTGKTLEIFRNMLPINISDLYLGLVAFKNTNRYHHVTRNYHGGISPTVIDFAEIAFTANYTSTYKRNSYTNKNGVFDKDKSKIIRLIKKSYTLES